MTPQERRGFWLGLLGVVIFSGTFPATRLAVATLDPVFVACGRAVAAALLAACALAIMRRPQPRGRQWWQLTVIAGGVVFGFPMLASWAMRYVPSSHGAVMAGILPLATASYECGIAARGGFATRAGTKINPPRVETRRRFRRARQTEYAAAPTAAHQMIQTGIRNKLPRMRQTSSPREGK